MPTYTPRPIATLNHNTKRLVQDIDDIDVCAYCGKSGLQKGLGSCGHVHCRGCEALPLSGPGSVSIRSPDNWTAQCSEKGGKGQGFRGAIEVEAFKYREEPWRFEPPFTIFHTGGDMVDVVVGTVPYKETYTVHAPLLRASSSHFSRVLPDKHPFMARGGENKAVELPDEELPHIFGNVLEYLYFGRIREREDGDGGDLHFYDPPMVDYFHVWLLAHRLEIPSLLNYAPYCLLSRFDAGVWFWDFGTFVYEVKELEKLYAKAPQDSVMRRFLVHLQVWGREYEVQLTGDAPHEMVRDVHEEKKRKSEGQVKNPLLDVRNYFTEEVPVGEM